VRGYCWLLCAALLVGRGGIRLQSVLTVLVFALVFTARCTDSAGLAACATVLSCPVLSCQGFSFYLPVFSLFPFLLLLSFRLHSSCLPALGGALGWGVAGLYGRARGSLRRSAWHCCCCSCHCRYCCWCLALWGWWRWIIAKGAKDICHCHTYWPCCKPPHTRPKSSTNQLQR